MHDTALEAEATRLAPAVSFCHGYFGSCISGGKAFKNPVVTPCHRRFGWQCLLHYYPHRCGGWSPLTMLQQYRQQSNRQKLQFGYRVIATASQYVRDEHLKHGFRPDRVHVVPYPMSPVEVEAPPATRAAQRSAAAPWCLLFVGRMEVLKGGQMLLEAMPQVLASLGRPVRLIFAGDGPLRADWERRAAQLQARHPELSVEFVGWVTGPRLQEVWAKGDLLVVPSLWPEPFGLVGPEAGLHGIPAAAFAVGGIPEWLTDGVNGYLAPGEPPTAAGLAEAITRCLGHAATYAKLCGDAVTLARRFSLANHLAGLMKVFEIALRSEASGVLH
jgi:glycosyltransferase involved in cell wall biosynthesis